MITKRIRCGCGRVYDPVKRPACPDCGAKNVVTVAPPTVPPIPVPPDLPVVPPPAPPLPAFLNPRTIMITAGALVLLVLVVILSRCGSDKKAVVRQNERGGSNAVASPSPSGGGTKIIVIPPHGGATESVDLNAMIANAAPGATVTIPAGVYPGGLIAARAVRLVGDPKSGAPIIIKADGKECLSVRAAGVFAQNIQFLCSGIGELPAVSVIDGADLELDGCRIQSSTAVAVNLAGKAALKALGTTFTAANGVGLRLRDAKANLTQCSFVDSNVGLSAWNETTVELQSCAFERNGANGAGGIMAVNGAGAKVSAKDCHFTANPGAIFVTDSGVFTVADSAFKGNGETENLNKAIGLIAVRKKARAQISNSLFEENRQGIAIAEGGLLEMEGCTLSGNGVGNTRQAVLITVPVSVGGEGSSATLRKTAVRNSAQFGAFVLAGGKIVFDDVEISGARTAGLVVGDASGGPGGAKIKNSRFHHNGTAIGIFAGSSVDFDDSECRENDEGILAGDRGTQLQLKNAKFLGQRDHGLAVYGEANGKASECEFRGNARGAQSGMPRKTSGSATLTLENCTMGGNRVFGVGAFAKNELILVHPTFDGTDKTNIYKERSATVQDDTVADVSPAPSASPQSGVEPSPAEGETPGASPTPKKQRAKTTRRRRGEDDAARILRRLLTPW